MFQQLKPTGVSFTGQSSVKKVRARKCPNSRSLIKCFRIFILLSAEQHTKKQMEAQAMKSVEDQAPPQGFVKLTLGKKKLE